MFCGKITVETRDLKGPKMLEKTVERFKEHIYALGMETGKELGIKQGKELGIKQGKELGVKHGMELGLEKGKLESARNLLDLLDSKTISERLGIPIEIVERMRRDRLND